MKHHVGGLARLSTDSRDKPCARQIPVHIVRVSSLDGTSESVIVIYKSPSQPITREMEL